MYEQIKKLWYIHNGILLSHKKNEIQPFVTTWMDLKGIMLRERSQTEKDKNRMIYLVYGILKKKKKLMDTENRLMVARGGGGGGREGWRRNYAYETT